MDEHNNNGDEVSSLIKKRKLDDDDDNIKTEQETRGVTNIAAVSFIPKEERKKCPYLDTINRQVIDTDMEKVCSITLSNLNVYACLVCGKFFQGRGKATPAYTHSVQCGHFVFLNLHDARAFCLPDGYEVRDLINHLLLYLLRKLQIILCP